jgi:hypothetical protein
VTGARGGGHQQRSSPATTGAASGRRSRTSSDTMLEDLKMTAQLNSRGQKAKDVHNTLYK